MQRFGGHYKHQSICACLRGDDQGMLSWMTCDAQ